MEACAFEDTGKRLLSPFYSYDGSLATLKESSEKIILCNGFSNTKCESFDGDETVAIAETNVQHDYACMSINEQGRPTIIAGDQSSSVEILETRSTNTKFLQIKTSFKWLAKLSVSSSWTNLSTYLCFSSKWNHYCWRFCFWNWKFEKCLSFPKWAMECRRSDAKCKILILIIYLFPFQEPKFRNNDFL